MTSTVNILSTCIAPTEGRERHAQHTPRGKVVRPRSSLLASPTYIDRPDFSRVLFSFSVSLSSGGWVKIKLKLPHFHVSDPCIVGRYLS